MTVRMRHPDLPDQPIRVDELTVPHYRAAGWDLVPADEPDPADSAPVPTRTPQPPVHPAAAPADVPSAAEPTESEPTTTPPTAKGRRATKEADQ